MAGSGVTLYATTAASNKAVIGTIDWREDIYMPSQINDNLAQIMADIRAMANAVATGWIEIGDGDGTYTATYVSATSFRFDGVNVASYYRAGMRVRVVAPTPGTIDGTIASSVFATHTTLTVTWDSGSLSNEAITSVSLGIGSGGAAPAAMRLLATLTAAGSTWLDFTLGNTALYSAYHCVVSDIVPATDNANLTLQGSADNLTTVDGANHYNWAVAFHQVNAATPTWILSGAALSNIILLSPGLDNVSGRWRGDVDVIPGSGSGTTHVMHRGQGIDSSAANAYYEQGSGEWSGLANAFRFAMTSGNIASGSIRVYGIPKV